MIWSAGAGAGHASPSRVKRVDHEGHIKVIDAVAQAAKEAGTTKRYITVSALDVRDKDNKPVPDWYDEDDQKFSKMIWGMMGTYMRARYASDKSLVEDNGQRGLDYTIVRPGWLSQDPGTGNIAAGKVKVTKMVSREDVTAVVELCMKNSRTVGLHLMLRAEMYSSKRQWIRRLILSKDSIRACRRGRISCKLGSNFY